MSYPPGLRLLIFCCAFSGFLAAAAPACELARQLSDILLVDAWDMFKQRVRKVAAHVRAAEKTGGAFFTIPEEQHGPPQ